ncbi:MAG: ribonuclease HI [Myxococcota bacterium]|jgi:ribonuclease HI
MEANWRRTQFRDDEVYARCDVGGALVEVKGIVDFCYQPGGKLYRTRADRLVPVADAEPERFAAPAASAGTKAKKGGSRGSSKAGGLANIRPDDVAIQLWTDGACSGNPGPSGAGVYYRFQGLERELSEYLGEGTNNIAELTAILRGVEMVEDPTTPVDIMTDSSYCIGLLTLGWKPKKNQALVAELKTAYARLEDVQVIKVKGHAGIEGNERADTLATEAVSRRTTVLS